MHIGKAVAGEKLPVRVEEAKGCPSTAGYSGEGQSKGVLAYKIFPDQREHEFVAEIYPRVLEVALIKPAYKNIHPHLVRPCDLERPTLLGHNSLGLKPYKVPSIKTRLMDSLIDKFGNGVFRYTDILIALCNIKGWEYEPSRHRGYYATNINGYWGSTPYLQQPSKKEPRHLNKSHDGWRVVV